MNRKFALFTVVIIFGFFWILIMNRDSVEAIEQTNKIITIKNIVKENIDENYIISRIRVEGNFVLEDVIYSDTSFIYSGSLSIKRTT